MMFHSVNLIKIHENKMKRPMTGILTKRLDPKSGEFVYERTMKEFQTNTPVSIPSKRANLYVL